MRAYHNNVISIILFKHKTDFQVKAYHITLQYINSLVCIIYCIGIWKYLIILILDYSVILNIPVSKCTVPEFICSIIIANKIEKEKNYHKSCCSILITRFEI